MITMARDLISLDVPKAPPRRFRVWKAGKNLGDFGTNNVTPGALSRVMADFEKRGTALVIDFEHALNPDRNPDLDPANPPPLAGHAVLSVVQAEDGPELWADPVRWSDCGRPFAVAGQVCCGKHQITTGQRGYISPDWLLDPDTREPTLINRLSLVAEPGGYGINMLAARAAPRRTTDMNDTDNLKALLAAAAGAASSADSDVQALAGMVTQGVTELAASKGIDLSATPAPAVDPGAAVTPAPDAVAAVAGADMDAKVEKAVASALAKHGVTVTASRGITVDAVRTIAREESERTRILEANKEALGALLPLLASKPLTEVKEFVKAVASKASKGKDGEGVRGASLGAETGKSYSLAERYSNQAK